MTFSALFLHVDYLKVTGLPLLFLRNSLETNLLCLAPYRILFPPDPPILPTVPPCLTQLSLSGEPLPPQSYHSLSLSLRCVSTHFMRFIAFLLLFLSNS